MRKLRPLRSAGPPVAGLAVLLLACSLSGILGAPEGTPSAPTTARPTQGELQTEAFQLRPNLARGKPATASGSQPDHPPERAVDGAVGYENSWVSSGGAEQWVEIDLQAAVDITSIELLVSQPRTAETVHVVYGRGPEGDERELHTFSSLTSNGQTLEYSPPAPWTGIRTLRVETLQTPSLAAWQEIQVFGSGAPSGIEQADVILYNGSVLTMEPGLPLAQGIAVRDGAILAVGSDEEVLALAGPETTLVDLKGAALMPGFVDAHNHLFGNPGAFGQDLEGVQQLALEHGITTFADMSVTPDVLAAAQDLARQGKLRLRVSLYLTYDDPCGEGRSDWYKQHSQSIDPGDFLHVTGVKVWSDGGACNAPAVTFEYPSGVGHGDLYFTQDEMNALVSEIQAAGFQAAIHALGDRAIAQVQEAIAVALAGGPNTPRHRIEHNAVLSPDLIPRYSEIGIVPIIFGKYSTCFLLRATDNFRYRIPESHKTWEWPWRELLEANPGLPIAWHSDAPVFEIDPFLHLFGFVTRKDVAPDGTLCEPPAWLTENTISVEQALPLMTINAAYALFREEQIGSLRPGKLADLIVVSADPLTVAPDQIRGIEVWMTMVQGRVEYCAPGHEGVCPRTAP